ncbi:MAG: class I SAM-dependent methyltransferase [Verrucomicrobiota bacterium]
MNDDPNHTPSSGEFFAAWAIYRSIIEHNLMRHDELVGALSDWWQSLLGKPKSILDLGCGDAHVPLRAFENFSGDYYGIDSSVEAIAIAEASMADVGWVSSFHLSDVDQALRKWTMPVDMVFAGYMLHHLSDQRKATAVQDIASLLEPGGWFVLYDIMRREEESRDDYVERQGQLFIEEWTQLSMDQRLATKHHIETSDFAVSPNQWREMAMAAGLTEYACLYRDDDEFWGLLVFAKN